MHDLSAGAWLNLCVATCQLQTAGLDKVLEEVEERFALEEVTLELSGKNSGLRVKKRDLRGRKR